VQDFIKDPWQSIHPEQRDDYLRVWTQSLRNGEQFSYRVRLRRFDGNYRWFYVRAAPLRDNKGITVHWFGTNMDIHDQHIAELNAARQKETAASESKYRALANSSPQIVFAATDSKGVIFVNTQWTHYSGQPFTDAAGLGFTNHVHPEDLVKCKLPAFRLKSEVPGRARGEAGDETGASITSSSSSSNTSTSTGDTVVPPGSRRQQEEQAGNQLQSPDSSSPSERVPAFVEPPEGENGKFSTDVDGRPCYADELRLKSKDGEYRWHLVRCVMVDSSILGNGAASWFGTCTDINDHKLLEQKMKDTMESKTRFLSNMSHEIRTPLIGISGMVEFLYHTSLTAEQTDYCDTIWSSSTGLLSIVNDILDLSKIEAGMMSLSFDWFDIRSTIESVNDAVSAQAIKKGLELNYLVADDVPPLVRGDQARIRQVLMNILGNAVKFTSAGEVFAHCHLMTDYDGSLSENEVVLSFEVIDSGEGFSEKEAELIFKPFSQIDATNTRQYGGSGLGLVISRQLVELHGGKMTGHSVPGKGSTFMFYAKFFTPEPPAAPITRSYPSPELPHNLPLRDPHSPYISRGFTQSPAAAASLSESDLSSPALASSASSEPSIRSARTFQTDRSSMSSVAPINVSRSDSESSGAQMKLVLPLANSIERTVPSAVAGAVSGRDKPATRTVSNPIAHPLLYSILVVCPQPYSLRAITRHVEASLPRDIPHQVTSRASLMECQRMLGGDSPVIFTHIVLNVSSPDQVMALMDQVFHSSSHTLTYVIAVADAKTRQDIKRLARERGYGATENEQRVRFLHKPIKPSRLAEIFDPKLDRNSGKDGMRRGGEQQSGHRKQEFFEMEKMVGHRGHRVLLVEDNPINQKVGCTIAVRRTVLSVPLSISFSPLSLRLTAVIK
jgi:signal transduction histidine kinase